MMPNPKSHILNSKHGFTFIEIILYLALTSIILVAAIRFSWDVIYGQVKSRVQREVNQNMRFVSERIVYEIRNSSSINSLTSSSISLAMSDSSRNPTNIDINNGKIRIGYGSSGSCPVSSPCNITSDQINVTQLNFTDLSTANSGHINLAITMEYLNSSDRSEWEKIQTYQTSVELRN
jgi:hypothetical protein